MSKKKKRVVNKKSKNKRKTKNRINNIKYNRKVENKTDAVKTKKVEKISDVKSNGTGKKIVNIKSKKIIIWIMCILIIVIFIFILIKPEKESSAIEFNSITIEEYLKLYDSKDLKYIYIKDENCEECDKAKVKLEKLIKEYSIKINELNLSELNSADKRKLQESNPSLKDTIDVPILLSVKNNEQVAKINLDKEYSAIKKIIDYSTNPNINSFNKITVNKYLSLLKSKEMTVIYIGSHTNSECEKFSSYLEAVSQELNFKINYLDTDLITKSEDWEKLNKSNKIFEENWFVPAILIIKEGNIVEYKMESMDKEILFSFFKRYGL